MQLQKPQAACKGSRDSGSHLPVPTRLTPNPRAGCLLRAPLPADIAPVTAPRARSARYSSADISRSIGRHPSAQTTHQPARTPGFTGGIMAWTSRSLQIAASQRPSRARARHAPSRNMANALAPARRARIAHSRSGPPRRHALGQGREDARSSPTLGNRAMAKPLWMAASSQAATTAPVGYATTSFWTTQYSTIHSFGPGSDEGLHSLASDVPGTALQQTSGQRGLAWRRDASGGSRVTARLLRSGADEPSRGALWRAPLQAASAANRRGNASGGGGLDAQGSANCLARFGPQPLLHSGVRKHRLWRNLFFQRTSRTLARSIRTPGFRLTRGHPAHRRTGQQHPWQVCAGGGAIQLYLSSRLSPLWPTPLLMGPPPCLPHSASIHTYIPIIPGTCPAAERLRGSAATYTNLSRTALCYWHCILQLNKERATDTDLQ